MATRPGASISRREVAVIIGDVPMGAIARARPRRRSGSSMLVNDVILRNLIPAELGKGFGFFQSQALLRLLAGRGDAGRARRRLGRRASCTCRCSRSVNGQPFGRPNAGVDMTFDFPTLIAHAAKTRPLAAGTIIGSGTVSNKDPDGGPGRPIAEGGLGYSCIAEMRTVETIRDGQAEDPFLRFGDTVRIEMKDEQGHSIFGAIEQEVRAICSLTGSGTADGEGCMTMAKSFASTGDLAEKTVSLRRDRPRPLRLHGAGRPELRRHRRRRRLHGDRRAGDAGDGEGRDRARARGHRQADPLRACCRTTTPCACSAPRPTARRASSPRTPPTGSSSSAAQEDMGFRDRPLPAPVPRRRVDPRPDLADAHLRERDVGLPRPARGQAHPSRRRPHGRRHRRLRAGRRGRCSPATSSSTARPATAATRICANGRSTLDAIRDFDAEGPRARPRRRARRARRRCARRSP